MIICQINSSVTISSAKGAGDWAGVVYFSAPVRKLICNCPVPASLLLLLLSCPRGGGAASIPFLGVGSCWRWMLTS
jgi:hypothetical protein